MNNTWRMRTWSLVLLLALLLPLAMTTQTTAVPPIPQSVRGSPVYLLYDPQPNHYRVPPAPSIQGSTQSATFDVFFVPNGQGDGAGATCLNWPAEAQTAFTYAASLWGARINSTVPIVIRACWANLGGGSVLGYGGAWTYHRDFLGAPVADTWYPVALANARAGVDLNGTGPTNPEMLTTYNTNFTWYFGVDGNPPAGQVDFVTVVLHEIAHGLGFSGSMRWQTGSGSWGYGSPLAPTSYDRFTQDGSGTPLLNYVNPSTALGTALTSNNVWFSGSNANAANGGSRVKLYAPATWQSGSSYSHLDYNTFYNTPNALMIYAISSGTAIHDPGPVTMGILQDIGWTVWDLEPRAYLPLVIRN